MKGMSLPEKIALCYGIGLGLLTVEMAMLSLAGIKFSVLSVAICLALTGAVILSILPVRPTRSILNRPGWLIATTSKPGRLVSRVGQYSLLEKFFIAGISLEVFYAFFRALILPMEAYDAIAIYALKSKIFYLAGGIPHDFFRSFSGFVPHIEYPLLIPLAESAFYTLAGSLNDLAVKVIFPLYYLSLLAVLYSVLRRFLPRRQSLLFTFLLATIPQVTDFATNGYTDIPFAFYCSSAVFYLYLWAREKRAAFLALSFVLSALAVWTKSEGLIFALINAVVAITCMARERSFSLSGCLYAAVSALTIAVYMFTLHSMELAVNSDFAASEAPFVSRLADGIGRIPAILYEYQRQFFGPKKWNIIWVLCLTGLVLGIKRIFSERLMPLTAAVLLSLCAYAAVYMVSSAPQGIAWHLSTTASRLFIHFVPIAVLWLAILCKEYGLEA